MYIREIWDVLFILKTLKDLTQNHFNYENFKVLLSLKYLNFYPLKLGLMKTQNSKNTMKNICFFTISFKLINLPKPMLF